MPNALFLSLFWSFSSLNKIMIASLLFEVIFCAIEWVFISLNVYAYYDRLIALTNLFTFASLAEEEGFKQICSLHLKKAFLFGP